MMTVRGLDDVLWGTPSRDDMINMQVKNYLAPELAKLSEDRHRPFTNSSEATKQELNQLVGYAEMQDSSARKEIFDRELIPYINGLFAHNQVDPDEVAGITKEVTMDVLPLYTSLKYHFQRPRPFQLALYHGLKFFPCYSQYSSSPSYPSGHAILCLTIAEVLAWKYSAQYPGCYEVMRNFANEVMESRMYMGVHFQSDNRFAITVVKAIMDNVEFRRKYNF